MIIECTQCHHSFIENNNDYRMYACVVEVIMNINFCVFFY